MKLQEKFVMECLSKGSRMDNRKLDEYREIQIEKNPSEKAEGSARVKLGETEVLVGVKFEVGEPFPDKPKEGVLITSAEFSPIASPDFEKGPPNDEAIELARVVDRGIRESEAIQLEKLFIEEKKVWKVYVDIHIVNHAGNLIDAAGLAAMVALLNAKIPAYEDGKVVFEKRTASLPVVSKTIPVTLSKIGDKILIDPNLEEEEVAGARLTVATNDDDNICAMQKGGATPLNVEELEKSVEVAIRKAKELRKLL